MPADDIDAAIQAFSASCAGPTGEDQTKIDVVLALEASLSDPRAMTFLVHVASDPAAYDLARIEALKVLGLSAPSAQQALAIWDALGASLLAETDLFVADYLAMNLGPFLSSPKAIQAIAFCLSPDQPRNLRHNALFSIERATFSPELRSILERHLTDPDLGAAAQRVLAQCGPRKPA